MVRILTAILFAILLLPHPADAQGRSTLGWGRLFSNDILGDGQDRWHSGAYTVSKVIGRGYDGQLPTRFGEMLEFRFRSETIAPANLQAPSADDRPYAGVLAVGLQTHFERRGLEIAVGGELVFVGPQTGVARFQSSAHEILGMGKSQVLDDQLPNGLFPTARIEIGRTMQLSPRFSFRPFLEAQAGVETLVRLGGDLTIGAVGQGDLYLRDVPTGQRYRVTRGDVTGFSAVLGADVAHVAHSAYLPSREGYELTDARVRARAGIRWQGEQSSVFYGLSWLGPDFKAQDEGQVVGSVQLKLRF